MRSVDPMRCLVEALTPRSAPLACSWSKAAADPVVGAPTPTPGEVSNVEARRKVLHLGLAGLGIGAGMGSLAGLRDFFTRRSPVPASRRLGGMRPAVITVERPEDEEEQRRSKYAAAPPVAKPMDPLNADPASLAALPKDYAKPEADHADTFMKWLSGVTHTDHLSKPWFLPAATAAAGAGIYGGYKGVTGLLDARRKADRDSELEDAKREYRDALVSQYKTASADDLGRDLDELAHTKDASINDIAGTGAGAYLTMVGLLAGGAGLGTYAYVKSHAPESRLAKAIQQRERLRWATHPPEIYAIGNKPKLPDDEEEEQLKAPVGPKLAMSRDELAALYKS